MRRRPQGRGRSVDRGTCRPGIEPRNHANTPGCRRRGVSGRPHRGASLSRDATRTLRGRRPRHARKHLAREPGDPVVCLRQTEPQAASGSLRTHADDERPREVGQLRSTDEARRTTPRNRRRRRWREGGWPRGTRSSATRPGHRAGTARPARSSGYGKQPRRDRKQRFTALLHHVYDVERLRAAYFALKRDAAAGSRRRDVAALRGAAWRRTSRTSSERLQAGSVPGEASAAGVHPEGGRAAAAARRSRAGRQDRPARRRRGAERHLRDGLPRLLVRIPARAQPASRAGCARRSGS